MISMCCHVVQLHPVFCHTWDKISMAHCLPISCISIENPQSTQRHKLFSRGSVFSCFSMVSVRFHDRPRGKCYVIPVSKGKTNRDRYRSSFGSISFQVPLRKRASAGSMNVQRMRLHARGLGWQMQRKGFALRTSTKPPPTWKYVAFQVRDLKNKKPYWRVRRDVFFVT